MHPLTIFTKRSILDVWQGPEGFYKQETLVKYYLFAWDLKLLTLSSFLRNSGNFFYNERPRFEYILWVGCIPYRLWYFFHDFEQDKVMQEIIWDVPLSKRHVYFMFDKNNQIALFWYFSSPYSGLEGPKRPFYQFSPVRSRNVWISLQKSSDF